MVCREIVIQRFVHASAQGILALRGQAVFDSVPEDEDGSEDGARDDEPVFKRGVVGKSIDVHAEEPDGEGEREEDECDPAEAPHGEAELEGVAGVADPDGFVHEVGEAGGRCDDVALPCAGQFLEFVGDVAEPGFGVFGVAGRGFVEVGLHFGYHVGVDVEQALDFEPLGGVFPEFGGARFVGGVFVDCSSVSMMQRNAIELEYILLSSKIPTCVSHAAKKRFQLYASALKISFRIKSMHSVASVSSFSISSRGR